MNFRLAMPVAILALLGARAVAGPLAEGRLSRVVNEVAVQPRQGLARMAGAETLLRPDEGVRVGARSRAEVVFADGTLVRIGAETALGLRRGSREVALERGTLLLEVPGFRGGARVRTGALTAVCGAATILVEHLPGQSLKLVVLAGDVRVVADGFLGDSLVVPPGKMLITVPAVKLIPAPVDVDLATLVKTSALVDAAKFSAGAPPLASLPRITREIARQAGSVQAKRLIPTNLAIVGSGTSVVIPAEAGPAPAPVTEEGVGQNETVNPTIAATAASRRGEGALPE